MNQIQCIVALLKIIGSLVMLMFVLILVSNTNDSPNVRIKPTVKMEPSSLRALYQSGNTCPDLT